MFAGAAFTDQSDIEATEAVDMLVALGVVNGYKDGSFKPNDTVTRAEMAKMIYVVRTGKSDARAYNEDKTTFTDINNHWARGYIKYCQSLGIIAGKNATTFDPDSTVTIQEAAKMLLVTLGYNAEKVGLVGKGWGNRTIGLADENGLLKDVNCGTTSPAPRQYAAQLIYNAIFAETVVLRDGEYTNMNALGTGFNMTVGEKYMDMVKEDAGVLYSCEKVDGKDYYEIVTSKQVNGANAHYDKVYEDVSDLLGQNIKVLAKVNANETSVYGVYADEDSKVLATGFVGALELDGDKKVKLNGTSYKVDGDNNTADLVREANDDAFASGKQLDDLAAAAAKGTITPATAASTIKLIDNNGNGKVDGAVLVPVQVAKVSAVSKTSLTLNFLTNGVANSTLKFDDADVYEGVAKNDYVTIVDDEFRSTSNSLVSKLDVVSADAAATRTNEVKVDGEWYKLAKDDTNTVISVTTGNTYDFVMVGGVVVNAEETAASSSNIAYISGIEEDDNGDNKLTTSIGETTGTLKVRMFFQDGTDKEVKVSKIDGEKIVESGAAADQAEASELTANKMYTYSELSDGTYDVKAVSADNEVGMDWVASPKQDSTASSTYYKQKIGGYAVADEAVVFVQTGKETKVLTGKQVKNWADDVTALDFTTANTQILTKSTNGIAYVKFAVLYATTSTNVPGASNDKLYAYLTADAYQATVDGEKKAAFDVWTGTENVTLYEDVSSHDSLKAGNVIEYSENGKFISDIDVVGKIVDGNLSGSTNMVAITGFNDKTVAYRYDNTKTEKNIDLADNCVFIAVNDDKNEGMEGSIDTVTMANEFVDENGKVYYVPNGYIVLNEDGDEIVAIIFDADNSELDVTYGKGDVDMLMEK